MKLQTAVGIIVVDVILFGFALAVTGASNIYTGGLVVSIHNQSSQVLTFPNGTIITVHRAVLVPMSTEYILGLWLLFFGLVAAFDMLLVNAQPIGKTLDKMFNHRITWFVRHGYTPEEIELVKRQFGIILQRKSDAIAKEEKT